MKKLLFIALLVTSLSSFAQFTKKELNQPQLYIPSAIMVGTFTTNSYLGDDITLQQRTTIALTGALSAALAFTLFEVFENKIKNKKHHMKLIVFNHKHK